METLKPQAVFVDRDGTLIEHIPYLCDPASVTLLPGVQEALWRLQAESVRLFLFTNQSGVGRGLFTMADVEAVNQRMIDLLGLGSEPFAGICIAPEMPGQPSCYRKPSPRFIHEMLDVYGIEAEAAWMIGDSPVDWEAGIAAGIMTAAIERATGESQSKERSKKYGVATYSSLLEWVNCCCSRR